MAEDKENNAGRELMDMDFLGDAQSEVNRMSTAGLYDKLAQFGKQEAQQPLIADATRRQLWKPISTMVKKAETQVQLGMAAYIMANPEIDESKVFDGTEGQLESITTESSARFKELNRQLAYMTPAHPDYAEVANEINSINKNLVQLRDDNSKLLNVRNGIKDMDTEEMSSGQTPGEVMMYNDILVGNKENFKTIDGKLHWVDPTLDDDDPMKNTAVSDINAGGPTMTNDAAFDDHNTLMNTMRTTPAADLNDRDVDYQVNKMFKGIGNDGVKSLIFDSQGEEVSMYDTDEWFQSWYDANGITTSEGQTAEMNRIKKNGVLSTGTFAGGEDGSGDMTNTSVKKHFAKWYAERLKETPKTGNGKPAEKTDLNDPFKDGRGDGTDDGGLNTTESKETNELINSIAGPKAETGVYATQSGSGVNFGDDFSPFAGITQYGWQSAGLSGSDHVLELGKGVPEALEKAYSEYGFKFSNVGNVEDVLSVTYQPLDENGVPIPGVRRLTETFEFDNYSGGDMSGDGDRDHKAAIALQQFMHKAIGYNSDYVYSDDDLKVKLKGL
tara:strand:+ start:620 stop:2287 length:1668 start_codon:yes stop_codon:yes gene_type:complete